jgi:hypothetical protein
VAGASVDFVKGEILLGRYRFRLPQTRTARITVGLLLIVGGILGFLPVLGFWMLPLGLLILSQDLAPVRRWRRRLAVSWQRRKNEKQSEKLGDRR